MSPNYETIHSRRNTVNVNFSYIAQFWREFYYTPHMYSRVYVYVCIYIYNGIWRITTNKELDELIKHRNIINYVQSQRLSWFRHK
jgi:hypothetical protein